jgi:prepilin-type N-terminal cleavage/methylation domain-containing protein
VRHGTHRPPRTTGLSRHGMTLIELVVVLVLATMLSLLVGQIMTGANSAARSIVNRSGAGAEAHTLADNVTMYLRGARAQTVCTDNGGTSYRLAGCRRLGTANAGSAILSADGRQVSFYSHAGGTLNTTDGSQGTRTLPDQVTVTVTTAGLPAGQRQTGRTHLSKITVNRMIAAPQPATADWQPAVVYSTAGGARLDGRVLGYSGNDGTAAAEPRITYWDRCGRQLAPTGVALSSTERAAVRLVRLDAKLSPRPAGRVADETVEIHIAAEIAAARYAAGTAQTEDTPCT